MRLTDSGKTRNQPSHAGASSCSCGANAKAETSTIRSWYAAPPVVVARTVGNVASSMTGHAPSAIFRTARAAVDVRGVTTCGTSMKSSRVRAGIRRILILNGS